MDTPLSFGRAFVAPLCCALAVVGLLALGLRSPAGTQECDAYCTALIASHSRQMAAQAASLDSARTALSHASEHVTRDVVRYRAIRDTLNIHDTVQVKVFVAKADSVVRACTELAESCALFRVRAESSLAGLTVDRDLWKGIAESRKPSRWDGVKSWVIRGVLVYGAFRLGQAAR